MSKGFFPLSMRSSIEFSNGSNIGQKKHRVNKYPRILFLSTYYYPVIGGAESHARQLAVYLKQNEFDIRVLTKRLERNSPNVEDIDGIPVYRISPSGHRASFQKWIMIPFATAAMLRLRNYIDLIYVPDFRGIGVAAILAGKILKRPVILRAGSAGIISCRNWDLYFIKLNLDPKGRLASSIKMQVRRIYTSAKAFICISREIVDETLKCDIFPNKIHYVPNAVDTKKFRPPLGEEKQRIRYNEGFPKDKVLGIYVGRLSTEKGILDLVEAWRLIETRNAILLIVGPEMPGHHMDAGPILRKLIQKNCLNEKVILYGPSQDVPQLLRAADVFIQPSHYEGFPNTAIEAMATGLPLIASKVGAINDFLVDGINALLCEPGSHTDLARKLRLLNNDASLRARIGEEARLTVETGFAKKLIFNKFSHLFREIASDRKGN